MALLSLSADETAGLDRAAVQAELEQCAQQAGDAPVPSILQGEPRATSRPPMQTLHCSVIEFWLQECERSKCSSQFVPPTVWVCTTGQMPLRIPQGAWRRWRCCAWHRCPAPSAGFTVRCRSIPSIHLLTACPPLFHLLRMLDGSAEAINMPV